MRLFPEVANLMYQITELILSRQRRTNDPNANAEPDGNNEENETGTRNEDDNEVLRSDMVPDMLKKVMSMLSHLVRAKKELAERVRIFMCAQWFYPRQCHNSSASTTGSESVA